jgi:glycosidase
MVYGENMNHVSVTSDSKEFLVEGIEYSSNTNYAFVNISISENAKSGAYKLLFKNNFGEQTVLYNLDDRLCNENNFNGFSNEDVVYLIFPDRFVNGDTSNDFLLNVNEKFGFREENGRHGGDLKGIISKLDYLKDLGITAIWSTPLVENNMYMSYHGYAATDFYNIDPRHGTNELYKEFVKKAHDKGIKVIMDHVANHIGVNHKWIGNFPTETWLNGTPDNHLPPDHNKVAYVDIYASEKSKKSANEGWFVDYMPDLNQRDQKLAKYIIQNSIWWIEYSGIDGIREDTYPYANQKFMAEWAKTILEHYPKFNIVGEVWKGDPAFLAAYQTGSFFPKEFDSHLPVVTDFAIRDELIDYMSGKSNINVIYEVLGKDFVYPNPDNLLVFFDNHDVDRGMYAAKWNMHNTKLHLP